MTTASWLFLFAAIPAAVVPYSTYYATKAAMIHLTPTNAVRYPPKHIRVKANSMPASRLGWRVRVP
jgi:hypothetical protein